MRSIAVVVPAYNAEPFVAEAIASIRSQEVDAAVTIIVVDDGSTDGTSAAARDAGADVVLQRSNGGIGAARNSGIAQAQGDLLAFLDADDLWPAGSLAARLEAMTVADAEAAFGFVEQFGEGHVPDPPSLAYLAGSMLIARAAFDRVGPFDEAVAVGEFIDWYARAQEAGISAATTESVVLRRRIHTTNTGIVKRDQTVDYTRVLRRALERRRAQENP